jgi:hypothetical protein
MFGLNPYLLGGFAAVLLAALGFAGCEHKNAKAARSARDTAIVERDQARSANASQLVTIGAQAKALKDWQALHRTPEEVAAIVANADQFVAEIDRLGKQVRLYRDRDKTIVECVKLLQVAYATCPGRFAILHQYATPGGLETN